MSDMSEKFREEGGEIFTWRRRISYCGSMITVASPQDLRRLLAEQSSKHYVYILRLPDHRKCWDGIGTPFYVGIGQGLRIFEHERQASADAVQSAKVHVIRAIATTRREVVTRHPATPYRRTSKLWRMPTTLRAGSSAQQRVG